MTNSALISINTPFDGTLTDEQRKQLLDPWSFSQEEQFYILFASLRDLCTKYYKNDRFADLLSDLMGGIKIPNDPTAQSTAIHAMKTMSWMTSHVASLPPIQDGKFYHQNEDLDRNKLRWGGAVMKAALSDDNVAGAWAFMLESLLHIALPDVGLCAKLEAKLHGTAGFLYPFHVESAQLDADEGVHKMVVLNKLINEWKPKWLAGEPVPGVKDLQAALDQYYTDNPELSVEWTRRRNDINTRANQATRDNKKQKESKSGIKTFNFGGLTVMMVHGEEKDCRNPDCMAHGQAAPRREGIDDLFDALFGQR
jgi:hypothetical protein